MNKNNAAAIIGLVFYPELELSFITHMRFLTNIYIVRLK